MAKYCTNCGDELEKDCKFCVKCGNKNIQRESDKKKPKKTVDKKATMADEKTRLNQLTEKIRGWKEEGYKVDELESKIKDIEIQTPHIEAKPSIPPIREPKYGYVLGVIALFVIIAIIAGGIYGVYLADSNEPGYDIYDFDDEDDDYSDYGGRTFTVTVENTCDSDAECYLTVDGLRYYLLDDENYGAFTIHSGGSMTINIVEDELYYRSTDYDITLFETIGHMEEGTAFDVTESADFLIYEADENLFIISTVDQ